MNTNPATQAQVDDLAERLARAERIQEETRARANTALCISAAAVVVVAMGVRAGRRAAANGGEGWIKVPAGHSVVTLPPGQSHQNR